MQRPAPVTVFGILNIVFAVIGVFGILGTVVMLSVSDPSGNPVIKAMQDNPSYSAWIKLTIPLGLAGCLVSMAAGIGLLYLKPWARWLSIVYAAGSIVFGALGLVVNYVLLFGPLLEEASNKGGPESAGAIGGAIGGSIGGVVSLIYPILLLIFMTRANVAAAFRPAGMPPPLRPDAGRAGS